MFRCLTKRGRTRNMAAKARPSPRTPTPTPTPMPTFSPNGMPPEGGDVGDADCDVIEVGGVGGVVVVIGPPVKEASAALKDLGFNARIFAPQVSIADLLLQSKYVAV